MDCATFSSIAAGQCRRTLEGYNAFFPNVLPPEIEVDWELAGLLSDADRALSELSGTGRLLPNPHLLISPYLRREAILSSRIENTIAGMDELFYFEVERETRKPDVREVANYVEALAGGLEKIQSVPISSQLIRELHGVLMRQVRGGRADLTPGEFRTSQNWIGPAGCTLAEASYVPPPPAEMLDAISDWERYLNEGPAQEPPLIQCALMHYQFEAIHPFLDGNGRIGRLLITLYLCERKCLAQPLLYLSAFFDQNRDEYYRALMAVSQRGDWRGWIAYFLRGVREQSMEALTDTRKILDLYEQGKAQIQQTGKRLQAAMPIYESLFLNPVVSVSRFAERSEMTFPTVQKGVEFLCGLGILREATGQQRNRLYIAPEVMAVMRGDRLKAVEEGDTA